MPTRVDSKGRAIFKRTAEDLSQRAEKGRAISSERQAAVDRVTGIRDRFGGGGGPREGGLREFINNPALQEQLATQRRTEQETARARIGLTEPRVMAKDARLNALFDQHRGHTSDPVDRTIYTAPPRKSSVVVNTLPSQRRK